MQLLLRWVINALALLVVAYIVPGFHVASFYTALMVALILGIINAVIRPILLLLTLPVTVLTLGLFALILNALLILFVSSIVKGFTIDGFWPALVGGTLLWLIAWITGSMLKKDRKGSL
jgi:putative membrane protein